MSDINDPKKFRSAASILQGIDSMHGDSLKIGLIEKTLRDLDSGKIVTVSKVREQLYDKAVAIYEEADPEKRKGYAGKMKHILESGRDYATQQQNTEQIKYFKEFLQVLPGQKEKREERQELTDKISAVAVYAGLASAFVFFSASSITGNVVLDVQNTIFSRSTIAIGIGIIVVCLSFLLSRKR